MESAHSNRETQAQLDPALVLDTVLGLVLQADIKPQGAAHLADRLTVFFSSCDARRIGQWENVRWSDFIGSDRYGEDYRRLLDTSFSKLLWGSAREETSTKIVGKGLEWIVDNILGRNSNGPLVRNFDLPTNEAFIEPWIALLRQHGVRLHLHHELAGFAMRDGCIASAHARTARGLRTVKADWYVCAVPLAQATGLWSHAMVAADPRLALMSHLDTGWGNGLKFFLRRRFWPPIRGSDLLSPTATNA